MQDGIIKGTGNSRYLKSIVDFLTQYPTYNDFAAALVAGTLPIDLNGINETGWDQLGTALNKANLLSDETAAALGLDNTAVVDDALKMIPQPGTLIPESVATSFWADQLGDSILPCAGQILSAEDYPLYAQVQGPIVGYTWEKMEPVGFPTVPYNMIQLENGRLVLFGYNNNSPGFYISDNNGETWTLTQTTSPADGTMPLLQKEDGTIICVSRNITFVSSDNGQTWSQIQNSSLSALDSNGSVSYIIEAENGRILANYTAQNDNKGYIVSSDNNGATWETRYQMSSNTYVYFYFAKDGKNNLYSLYQYSNNSNYSTLIFISEDNGESWNTVTAETVSVGYRNYGMICMLGNYPIVASGYKSALLADGELFPLSENASGTNVTSIVGDSFTNPVSVNEKIVMLRNFLMVNADSNWLQMDLTSLEFNNTTQCRQCVLQNGDVLIYQSRSNPSPLGISHPQSDIIILPYKPGFFVKVK